MKGADPLLKRTCNRVTGLLNLHHPTRVTTWELDPKPKPQDTWLNGAEAKDDDPALAPHPATGDNNGVSAPQLVEGAEVANHFATIAAHPQQDQRTLIRMLWQQYSGEWSKRCSRTFRTHEVHATSIDIDTIHRVTLGHRKALSQVNPCINKA